MKTTNNNSSSSNIKKKKRKVLLIGWDAADWKVINPLIDAGKMPALEKLVNGGVMGNLATLDPPLSPMLWTSIATGKTADKHGIMGFTQPDTENNSIRPVLSTSRKVKAIWNILMQNDLKSHVVGWWPSHPAEPIDGIYISNFYQKVKGPLSAKDSRILPKGTVHPENLSEFFGNLKIFPEELTQAHLYPFVPNADKVDQKNDRRLSSIAKITSEASTIHAAATWIMENEDWDFMAVYYDAIDHYGHGFMNFHPPKRDNTPKKLYDLYNGVVEGGYRFHDMMLERMIELAGDDTTIILVSDHGFHSDHLRPSTIPKEPAGPAAQHRQHGIIVVNGPDVKKDERIYGATLLDITPTILDLFNLPVARDMQGKQLVEIYDKPKKTDYIKSWEEVEGKCGAHSKDSLADPWAEQEAINQLVALGYIEEPSKDNKKNVERTIRESKFYLARVYMSQNKFSDALPLLEELYEKFSSENRFGIRLIQCYEGLREFENSNEIIDKIRENSKKITPAMDFYKGRVLFNLGKNNEALEYLKKAEKYSKILPGFYNNLANVYYKMNDFNKAKENYLKAIEIDEDNTAGYFGLANCLKNEKLYEDAAENYLTSIGLQYHQPKAHFYLAESLQKLKYYKEAASAFEVALSQAPGLKKAHLHLVNIYFKYLNKPKLAEKHLIQANKIKVKKNKKL